MTLLPRATVAALTITAVLGCTRITPTGQLDPDRILHMAGEEAGQIASPRDRLARQLNVADRETLFGQPAAARTTLREARKTLEAGAATTPTTRPTPAGPATRPAFDPHTRLAGWISISELSRRAEDRAFANEAVDRAVADLRTLDPHPERCQYVLGVAGELRALRGDAPAAKLIAEAGNWAVDIADADTRRQALGAFAYHLFVCGDYDAARDVLRRDADPAWRSDTLTAMADLARWEVGGSKMESRGLLDPGTPMATWQKAESDVSARSPKAPPTSFGKPLDYQTNFRDAR
ncbi:MAG TPA: hypothetical protein VEA69_08865 [Tepidisphaeraceae bacterium]|nr:hypothetical protein [Tepidisphaeraceae bacterium]